MRWAGFVRKRRRKNTMMDGSGVCCTARGFFRHCVSMVRLYWFLGSFVLCFDGDLKPCATASCLVRS
ncbi:hypothetical protein BHE74_00025606 [Ensete ventricosum]|uniref:Uncharacterized protein n=1 Tax=Ensete ventricosum TaxID=4639 RepID=A0A444DXY7_ENSVE|nr:hypothetical protein B296_00031660 [Ensete ventricosum]RWW02953.1 hypothetical protein GW17_00033928 [Ensete ventricosum]RWW66981.1 hypothetical protein BHE74_00025606 [Ensete ventricosum]